MLQFKEENETKEPFNPEQAGTFIHDTLDQAKKTGHGESEYQQMMLDYALQKAREEDRPLHEVYREARLQANERLLKPGSVTATRLLGLLCFFLAAFTLLFVGRGGVSGGGSFSRLGVFGFIALLLAVAFFTWNLKRRSR